MRVVDLLISLYQGVNFYATVEEGLKIDPDSRVGMTEQHSASMSVNDTYYRHRLSSFLQPFACPTGKNSEASLCGMGSPKGAWLIPDDKYEEFLDLLHDYLFVAQGRPRNLVEQPRLGQPKPLLIDLDFKFAADSRLTHRFTRNQIRDFIRRVCRGLNTFFPMERYEELRFFVSQRPQAYPDATKKTIKDGIHIQCPDITLTNEKQKALRNWLLENNAIDKSFSGMEYKNEPEDIYDESMVRKQGWFLYGESKPNIPPYELDTVYVFSPRLNALDEEDKNKYDTRELLELLSVRYNLDADDNEVRPEKVDMFNKYVKGRGAVTSTQQQRETPAASGEAASGGGEDRPPVRVYVPEKYDEEEIAVAARLALECLSETRADNYKTWMEVGWGLYNIDPTEGMFEIWKQFSQKSAKSTGTDWDKLRNQWLRGFSKNTAGSKLTLKSLHYWARDDNLEQYKKIVEEDVVRYIQYRVDDTHFHVARLLQRMYKGSYCASIEPRRTEWYVFDDHIQTWRHTNQGIELREKLSTEVADLVIQARMRLKKQGQEDFENMKKDRDRQAVEKGVMPKNGEKGDDFIGWWSQTLDGERFTMLTKLEKHLYTTDFKNCVLKEAAEMFAEEDFTNKLNMNPFLFVCRNGVLDLRNELEDEKGNKKMQVVFRDGKPDDFMSFLAGRIYPDTEPLDYTPWDPSDKNHQELMDFLTKIFPDPAIRNYVIRLCASCLEGTNREQCYYTFIGVGGNGKSKLVDLMRYTFGDYCSSLQATALTRKRPDSGAANPDIIAIKNKRFIYLQEPDDREPLNTSRMKQFSGEDVVEARGLFEEQQRFRITGKLFMMCNRYPPIHAMDRGTWRRIRAIHFGSRFVDPTDPDLKASRAGVFLRDNSLDGKLRKWREAWLALLVRVYETEYLVNGLEPIPQAILDESNRYKENFDQYGKFKSERMIDFRDPRGGLTEYGDERVSLKDVMLAYNNWTRQNEGTLVGKKLNRQELQIRMDEDFGSLDTTGCYRRCAVFFDDEGRAEFEGQRRG